MKREFFVFCIDDSDTFQIVSPFMNLDIEDDVILILKIVKCRVRFKKKIVSIWDRMINEKKKIEVFSYVRRSINTYV